MAEETIVKIEKEEAPAPPAPPSDKVLELAERVGHLTAERHNDQKELGEIKSTLGELSSLMRNQCEAINDLRSRAATTEQKAAELSESQKDITSQIEDDSENESAALPITPLMETKIEIEQKPATRRSLMSRILFGP